jgi:hypothetical protein
MSDYERRELIAALHELTTFAEGILEVNGRLVEALADQENPPTPKAVADARRHHEPVGAADGGVPQAAGGSGD